MYFADSWCYYLGRKFQHCLFHSIEKLKQRYHIEMCFSYPDEDEENRYMWCCGIVKRVKIRYDKMIKVDIKWEECFIACGESDRTEDILKKRGIRRRQNNMCGGRMYGDT